QVIASSIASLSFFPGGLGIFEGSLTGLLTFLGLSIEQAFTATILFRGFTYWLPMLPGFLLTQKELLRI
ncbi:TPA: flippase-like domain-containing protein, partial [Legionella pneumophila]|nr:flippase-like domain-containing protein [Legionella pneumophila]